MILSFKKIKRKLIRPFIRKYRFLEFKVQLRTSPNKFVFNNYDKCFVIGLGKTGTTSMHKFLKSHGSKHLTMLDFTSKLYKEKEYCQLIKISSKFNSFDDHPWNKLDIVEILMKSKDKIGFIYTMRDPNLRFESKKRFNDKRGYRKIHENDRKKIIDIYNNHLKSCLKLSRKYNKEILFIDVTKDKNVSLSIENYLGLNKAITFPHINKS